MRTIRRPTIDDLAVIIPAVCGIIGWQLWGRHKSAYTVTVLIPALITLAVYFHRKGLLWNP